MFVSWETTDGILRNLNKWKEFALKEDSSPAPKESHFLFFKYAIYIMCMMYILDEEFSICYSLFASLIHFSFRQKASSIPVALLQSIFHAITRIVFLKCNLGF